MELKKAIQIFFYGIILIVLVGALIGLSTKALDNVTGLFISLAVSLILSAFVGKIIEAFSDDTLKEIFWVVEFEVFGYEVELPISLFTIFTIIIKIWWFG